MVKEIKLRVTSSYVVPTSIKLLKPKTTEIYLDCIDGLLTEYASISNGLEMKELTEALELKYNKMEHLINHKNKQKMDTIIKNHNIKVKEYEDRVTYLQSTVDANIKNTNEIVEKKLTDAKLQFDRELEDWKSYNSRKVTLENDLEKYENEIKIKMLEADLKNLTETNNKLQLTVNNLIEDNSCKEKKYKEQLEKECDRISEQVKCSVEHKMRSELLIAQNTNEHLKEQIEIQKTTIKNVNKMYNTLSEDKASVSLGMMSTDKTIKDLTEQIKPIIKMYNGSNEEKGTAGEQKITSLLLEQRYQSAKIFDTSGQSACGDIHFHWNDIKCLIEVKNKKKLTLEDIKKFERDVRNCKESEKNINCAVFVSLCSSNFPGRSREAIQLDTVNGVPVIYTYLSNIETFHYSILCLNNLVKNTKGDSYKINTLINYYNEYARHIVNSINYFNKLIKSHETTIRSLKKEVNKLIVLDEELSSRNEFYKVQESDEIFLNNNDEKENEINKNKSLSSEINNLREEKDKVLDLTPAGIKKSIEKVVNYYINFSLENKSNPSISDILRYFNITTHTLLNKLNGIKYISNTAKNKYLYISIDDNTVKKFKKYKEENGVYPKRSEIIQDYISQRQLTKISYVLRCSKITEYIYEHLDKRIVN